jgi:hypothetical protein
VTLGRGARSAGLALTSAAIVVLLFTVFADNPLVRGLETASLDLRFRLRGVRLPGPEVTLILVDDRSLESFGRWPFSRALFARALEPFDLRPSDAEIGGGAYREGGQEIALERQRGVIVAWRAVAIIGDPDVAEPGGSRGKRLDRQKRRYGTQWENRRRRALVEP